MYLCIQENRRFCLIKKGQLPTESSTLSENRPNRYQTLELRIIALENAIDILTAKLAKLEEMVEHVNSMTRRIE